ncbi:MAG: flagellar hook-length control protein FliK [Hyphomonadaceae bacterium JAD_PAG50586_4]|nr:MAG: flagellar hook-length control protein FliK [Hyphomonadaceae bacterium JAD_PAG50586_4]
MGYAAEAFVSAAPPPSKSMALRGAAQPQSASAASFDDHLAAESQDAAVHAAPAARDANARAETAPDESNIGDEPSATDANTEATLQAEPQTQPPIGAPVLVQLIAHTNVATATDPKSTLSNPGAPVEAAPSALAPIDAAAPLDAMASPSAAPGATPLTLTPPTTPAPGADVAGAPVERPADAGPPPQIVAQAAPAPRAPPAPAAAEMKSAEKSQTSPTPSAFSASPAPRLTPEAVSTPPTPGKASGEPEAKIVVTSDDGSTQEKFEAALEKSAPRGQAKPDAGRPSAPPAPIIVADASGAATAGVNADAGATIAPAASALSAAAANAAAQTQAVTAEHLARSAPPAAQVAREIVRRFDGETTRFELRLDPPELGRVEVKLEVTRDHKVTAVIAADSPQALTELARHARELEQNLQAAGLELSDNGLSFDLRQSREDAQDANGQADRGGNSSADIDTVETQAPLARPIGLERWRGVRVDVIA